MALLRGDYGLFAREFGVEELTCLAVAKGRKRAADISAFREQRAGFFHQTFVEHLGSTQIDACIERLPFRIEAEAKDAEADEGIAALLPEFAHGTTGGKTDLDGADELGGIVGVNLCGGCGIHVEQDAVKVSGAAFFGTFS